MQIPCRTVYGLDHSPRRSDIDKMENRDPRRKSFNSRLCDTGNFMLDMLEYRNSQRKSPKIKNGQDERQSRPEETNDSINRGRSIWTPARPWENSDWNAWGLKYAW